MTENQKQQAKSHYMGLGMAIGMIMFVPLGVILSIVTDTPGLIGIGPATGIGVGLAIGEGLYRRHRQAQEESQHEGH